MNFEMVVFHYAPMFTDAERHALTEMYGKCLRVGEHVLDIDTFKKGVNEAIEHGWLVRDERQVLQQTQKLSRLFRVTEQWLFMSEETYYRYGPDWPWQRFLAVERDNYTCQDCGADDVRTIHVHHKKPVAQGGGNELSNLITLCPKCHGRAETLARKGEEWHPTSQLLKKRVRSHAR